MKNSKIFEKPPSFPELAAGGKPSTWLPPGRPVEHPKITSDDQKIILDWFSWTGRSSNFHHFLRQNVNLHPHIENVISSKTCSEQANMSADELFMQFKSTRVSGNCFILDISWIRRSSKFSKFSSIFLPQNVDQSSILSWRYTVNQVTARETRRAWVSVFS